MFEAARDKCTYEQGVLWTSSEAKVSEKGKVMITAMNVTEQDIYFKEENLVGTLSVVKTVDEFNEKKRVSSQTRSSLEERVSIVEVTKEEREVVEPDCRSSVKFRMGRFKLRTHGCSRA